MLGPDDHRAARGGDPVAIARLSSAGRVLPTVEVEIRGLDGALPPGEPGDIWVRGEQVSGEYANGAAAVDADGWFATRDRGWLDADGYLFIEGRSDDTIIRGGENIAPAEIEDVLLQHPDIAQCAVVGVPDDEWGERIAAAVVLRPGAILDASAVRDFARRSLRGSKTPDVVTFVDELPYTETGKLLRRVVPPPRTRSHPADAPHRPRGTPSHHHPTSPAPTSDQRETLDPPPLRHHASPGRRPQRADPARTARTGPHPKFSPTIATQGRCPPSGSARQPDYETRRAGYLRRTTRSCRRARRHAGSRFCAPGIAHATATIRDRTETSRTGHRHDREPPRADREDEVEPYTLDETPSCVAARPRASSRRCRSRQPASWRRAVTHGLRGR